MSVAEKLKLDAERGRRRQDPSEVAQQAAQVVANLQYLLLVFTTLPSLSNAQNCTEAFLQ